MKYMSYAWINRSYNFSLSRHLAVNYRIRCAGLRTYVEKYSFNSEKYKIISKQSVGTNNGK